MSPKLFPEIADRYGFVVIMYPNDHLPAHIHVYQGEKVARVSFETIDFEVMDSNGFRKRDLNKIREILQPYRSQLITIWNRMHPNLQVREE